MCSQVKLIFKATFVGTRVNIEDGCGRINSVIGRVLSPVFFFSLQINKFVRAVAVVSLFCQTLIEPRQEGNKLNRDHISCKITYISNGMYMHRFKSRVHFVLPDHYESVCFLSIWFALRLITFIIYQIFDVVARSLHVYLSQTPNV